MDDLQSATVRIPVRIRDGIVTFFYPGPMPKMREGAVGELVVDRVLILDERELQRLEYEEDRELLPAFTALRVAVVPRQEIVGALPRDRSAEAMNNSYATHFVEIELLEPLVLRLRGTKPGVLRPANCRVLALHQETPTLNQAYSLVARHFEPWRRSTTGNVFKKVYYRTNLGGDAYWRMLDDLRNGAEADLESRLFLPQGELFDSRRGAVTTE